MQAGRALLYRPTYLYSTFFVAYIQELLRIVKHLCMQNGKKEAPLQKTCSYLTFNTVDWIDVFIRPVYKQIIIDALNRYIEEKGLIVYAWCLMTNHLHLVANCKSSTSLSLLERDFKKHTTKEILEAIDLEPELRREWMLQRFELFSQSLKRIEKFQVWQNCCNPVLIDFKQVYRLQERILYVHENPVRDKIVTRPEDYVCSSAADYAGKKGLVNVTVINFEQLRISAFKTGE
jgi:putative transposase